MNDWISVPEAAERLGISEEMVRRHIRNNRILARRSGFGKRAAWAVDARQIDVDANTAEFRRGIAGIVTGRGGTPDSDAAFVEKVGAAHGPAVATAVHAAIDRIALLEQAAAVIADDPELRDRFAELDSDADRVEAEARELAALVIRAEQVRRRALELLRATDEEIGLT